jgi:hypothetical protein
MKFGGTVMKTPAAKPDMNLPIANVGVVGMQVNPLENIMIRSEYIMDLRRPRLDIIGPATEAPNKAPIVTRKLKTVTNVDSLLPQFRSDETLGELELNTPKV